MKLPRSFKEWWERQKEGGRALDAKFAPPRKPEYFCLFPGCIRLGQWIYLDDGRELQVPQVEMPSFFSVRNVQLSVAKFLDWLKSPLKDTKEANENNRLRNAIVMLACDEHKREHCPWTMAWTKKHLLRT